MTDTLEKESKPRAPRRPPVPVDYTLVALEGPPVRTREPGTGRNKGPVHDTIAQILAGELPPNQWYRIAGYGPPDERNKQSSAAKASDLRKTYPEETTGLEFMVGESDGERVIGARKLA